MQSDENDIIPQEEPVINTDKVNALLMSASALGRKKSLENQSHVSPLPGAASSLYLDAVPSNHGADISDADRRRVERPRDAPASPCPPPSRRSSSGQPSSDDPLLSRPGQASTAGHDRAPDADAIRRGDVGAESDAVAGMTFHLRLAERAAKSVWRWHKSVRV